MLTVAAKLKGALGVAATVPLPQAVEKLSQPNDERGR